MAVTLRSRREIELIRRAGSVVADVLSKLSDMSRPGVSTAQLDRAASKMALEAGGRPLFKGVRSSVSGAEFSGAICASRNNEVVHGVPSDRARLEDGDILSLDFGISVSGYCADAAVTVGVGRVNGEKRRLMDAAREALGLAVAGAMPGVKWSSIAAGMQRRVESAGFSVVRDFVGHGIGRRMHEDPRVPNFVGEDMQGEDFVLAEGMVLAVEPMINMGTNRVRTLDNGWTVVTEDGCCSAHFEHTIAIVEGGCEVLTAVGTN
jgi:methionyl aminopeptidase